MIYVKLHGRLGNHLFQIAAAATFANENKDNFCAICHDDYLLAAPDCCYIWEYVQTYLQTIYRNIDIREKLSNDLTVNVYRQERFEYAKIPYTGNDILLDGGFQSYKYFNEKIVQELFEVPPYVKEKIDTLLSQILPSKLFVSVNVRRGDYSDIPHKFPVCSKRYFKKAMKQIGMEHNFLFVSDDIEWCKQNFQGDNIFFLENSEPLVDLYVQTLAECNIISNSSFSWWGAYLNPNPDKIVIAPKPWFGKSQEVKSHCIKDLLPPEWVVLQNRMENLLWFRAKKMLILETLLNIRNKYTSK